MSQDPKRKRPPPPPTKVIPGKTDGKQSAPQSKMTAGDEASVQITVGGSTRGGWITCSVILLLFGLLFWWKPIAGLIVVVLVGLVGFFLKVPGLR
jgi:hypothetical protein